MATITIWGKYRGKVEKIDSASTPREAQYLAGEYALAYGRDWQVWAGRRDEEPRQFSREEVRRNWASLGIGN